MIPPVVTPVVVLCKIYALIESVVIINGPIMRIFVSMGQNVKIVV